MAVTHVEWLNENSGRAYPFMENCRRRPSDGSGGLLPDEYAIPNCAIVDFVVTVPHDFWSSTVYLGGMSMSSGYATFIFMASVPAQSQDEVIASVTVDLSTGGQNVWQPFGGSGRFADARGALVIGDPEKFASLVADGVYSFDKSETMFEPRCVRPSLARVSAITALDSGMAAVSGRLQGDVSIVAGRNIRLVYLPDDNAIRIDADSNSGYNEECKCEVEESTISSINGVSVNDVTIEGGDCIKITTEDGVIRIEDTCAKPCCGCAELSYLNQKSNEINTSLSKLKAYSEELGAKMTALTTSRAINAVARGS